ncbi:flagellar basal body-associated protein FliL [Marinomonas epiphytica]
MSLLYTMKRRYYAYFTFLAISLCAPFASAADEEGGAIPVYMELRPDFIVNYGEPSSKLKYIKTKINLRTDSMSQGLIAANMPLVRDAIVMFLSTRTRDQVSGAIAREQTRLEAVTAINEIMKEETGQEPVMDVLFASFVTQ